jgi:glyoxylase-like metal-dependent hydrolase (beta-lactamase superfamily II)
MKVNIVVIPVTPFAQNCSLIWDPMSQEGAFVDPGGDIDKLIAAAITHNVNISKVLLTHGHLDHVGAAEAVAKHFNVDILGPHQDDAFWLEALVQQSQMFGFPTTPGFLPDQWLAEGDTVNLGKVSLTVLHCPGHTPGHIAFVDDSRQKVIVGDILFAGSIGRTDFPKGDQSQLVNSIRTKLFTLPDTTQVYPGHGPTTTIGEERQHNPFVADSRFG